MTYVYAKLLNEEKVTVFVDYINKRIINLFSEADLGTCKLNSEDPTLWEIRSKIAKEFSETPAWISFVLSCYGYRYDEDKNQYVLVLQDK